MRVFEWGRSFAVRLRRSMALARLRKFRGGVPTDFKFDREEANRRWGLADLMKDARGMVDFEISDLASNPQHFVGLDRNRNADLDQRD